MHAKWRFEFRTMVAIVWKDVDIFSLSIFTAFSNQMLLFVHNYHFSKRQKIFNPRQSADDDLMYERNS